MAKTSGKADAVEVSELRKRIQDDQALLIQWAEEKVQLALTGHELLDTHLGALENDVTNLTQELQENGQIVDDGYGVDDTGYGLEIPAPEPPGRRGGGSRLHYATSYDSLEPSLDIRPGEEWEWE